MKLLLLLYYYYLNINYYCNDKMLMLYNASGVQKT